ncbi:MAG: NUDIX hydrolase [Anaerolineales bacterium]|nr:MAG: NUDIX hydrolase [Anaerolineales bacterium]
MARIIKRVKELKVFSNRLGRLYDDHVRGPQGDTGNYLRWQWKQKAVSIIPRRSGYIGLAKMFRYPISAFSWEFPRGGISRSESIQSASRRELLEETGLVGSKLRLLGSIFPDTGLIQNELQVVLAEIQSAGTSKQEKFESIGEIVWLTEKEFEKRIRSQKITCAITIASYSLYKLNT